MAKLNGVYSPTDSIKGFIPQKKVMCEYCGENKAVFSFEVGTPSGEIEKGDLVCPECIATWFTETPEDVLNMGIHRLEEN